MRKAGLERLARRAQAFLAVAAVVDALVQDAAGLLAAALRAAWLALAEAALERGVRGAHALFAIAAVPDALVQDALREVTTPLLAGRLAAGQAALQRPVENRPAFLAAAAVMSALAESREGATAALGPASAMVVAVHFHIEHLGGQRVAQQFRDFLGVAAVAAAAGQAVAQEHHRHAEALLAAAARGKALPEQLASVGEAEFLAGRLAAGQTVRKRLFEDPAAFLAAPASAAAFAGRHEGLKPAFQTTAGAGIELSLGGFVGLLNGRRGGRLGSIRGGGEGLCQRHEKGKKQGCHSRTSNTGQTNVSK